MSNYLMYLAILIVAKVLQLQSTQQSLGTSFTRRWIIEATYSKIVNLGWWIRFIILQPQAYNIVSFFDSLSIILLVFSGFPQGRGYLCVSWLWWVALYYGPFIDLWNFSRTFHAWWFKKECCLCNKIFHIFMHCLWLCFSSSTWLKRWLESLRR